MYDVFRLFDYSGFFFPIPWPLYAFNAMPGLDLQAVYPDDLDRHNRYSKEHARRDQRRILTLAECI